MFGVRSAKLTKSGQTLAKWKYFGQTCLGLARHMQQKSCSSNSEVCSERLSTDFDDPGPNPSWIAGGRRDFDFLTIHVYSSGRCSPNSDQVSASSRRQIHFLLVGRSVIKLVQIVSHAPGGPRRPPRGGARPPIVDIFAIGRDRQEDCQKRGRRDGALGDPSWRTTPRDCWPSQ